MGRIKGKVQKDYGSKYNKHPTGVLISSSAYAQLIYWTNSTGCEVIPILFVPSNRKSCSNAVVR